MEGTDTGEPYWFDSRPLTGKRSVDEGAAPTAGQAFRSQWSESEGVKDRMSLLRKVKPKAIVGDWFQHQSDSHPMKRFASANGARYDWQSWDRLPGMIFRNGERRDVVTWDGPPFVEFGNFNATGQELVQEFGYVAVRHDLDLPRMVLDARSNDATPPAGSGVYASGSTYTSLTENYRGSDSGSMMDNVRSAIAPLSIGGEADQRFATYCEVGREAAARQFLSGENLQVLMDVTNVFDVEFVDGWLFLYAYGIKVTTAKPERWAWIFSIASDVLDRLGLWGSLPTSASRPAFHTDQRIVRPADLAELPKPSPGWGAFWGDGLWS